MHLHDPTTWFSRAGATNFIWGQTIIVNTDSVVYNFQKFYMQSKFRNLGVAQDSGTWDYRGYPPFHRPWGSWLVAQTSKNVWYSNIRQNQLKDLSEYVSSLLCLIQTRDATSIEYVALTIRKTPQTLDSMQYQFVLDNLVCEGNIISLANGLYRLRGQQSSNVPYLLLQFSLQSLLKSVHNI